MKTLQSKLNSWGGLIAVCLLSIGSWAWVRSANLILSYNDSMSHLNIARRIVDNAQPGLAQIGTVWLPLSHLLPLPFIWNDWAWRSGFAGSIISMLAFIAGTVGIYLIVRELTASRFAAVVGAGAFAFNLNALYLQATPLTEMLYLGLFIWSVYCLLRYLQTDDPKFLIALGVLGFLQVLTRYDGWFVVVAQAAVVLIHQLRLTRSWSGALGRAVLVGTPAIFGIGLWLLWNTTFGSPLYFATGSGSAQAQQKVIEASSGLVAKHDVLLSTWLYLQTAAANVGLSIAALALVGMAYWLLSRRGPLTTGAKWMLAGVLVSPVLFNILTLFMGFTTISIPQLNSDVERGQWFNVRYGILALPMAAVAIGAFARWSKLIGLALLLVVALQAGQMWREGPITVLDGTRGASAFTDQDVSAQLAARVAEDEHVLMSFSSFNPVGLASGLELDQFVHEGVSSQWSPALSDPRPYARWIVMANHDLGDPVYDSLVKKNPGVLKTYKLVFQGEHASIYSK